MRATAAICLGGLKRALAFAILALTVGLVTEGAAVASAGVPGALAAKKKKCKALWQCAPKRYHLTVTDTVGPGSQSAGLAENWSAEVDLVRVARSIGKVDYGTAGGTVEGERFPSHRVCGRQPGHDSYRAPDDCGAPRPWLPVPRGLRCRIQPDRAGQEHLRRPSRHRGLRQLEHLRDGPRPVSRRARRLSGPAVHPEVGYGGLGQGRKGPQGEWRLQHDLRTPLVQLEADPREVRCARANGRAALGRLFELSGERPAATYSPGRLPSKYHRR
jgi:hypothetical protein